MLSQKLIDEIKQKIPLSQIISQAVELKQKGQGRLGLCPFHKEKTPSFYVRDQEGRFKCFGCGASGDVIEFLMRLRGITFLDAAKELAQKCGIKINDQKILSKIPGNDENFLYTIQKYAQEYFINQLKNNIQAKNARQYLVKKRKLKIEMILEAGFGFGGISSKDFIDYLKSKNISESWALKAGILKAQKFGVTSTFQNRITIPIKNIDGQIIAFGARRINDDEEHGPKYINTHNYSLYEKGKHLFGIYESKKAILKGQTLHLVEGYFDALALWAIGIPAIALCGTALTKAHILIIKQLTKKIILIFDRDVAGLTALKKSLPLLFEADIVSMISIIDEKDPGTYLDKESLELLKNCLLKRQDAFCYLIDQLPLLKAKEINKKLVELEWLFPIFKSINKIILKKQYANYLAKALHEDISIIWSEINKGYKNRPDSYHKKSNNILNGLEQLLLKLIMINPLIINEIIYNKTAGMSEVFCDFLHLAQKNINDKDQGFEHILAKCAEDMGESFFKEFLIIVAEKMDIDKDIANEILVSLKNKQEKIAQGEKIKKKREELIRAQERNDFSLIIKTLREQTGILKERKVEKKEPSATIKSKEINKNNALQEDYIIFDEENMGF